MIDDKSALAIIPARAGSKRIPNKNIKKFSGKPLIVHTIEHALAASYIDRVIVDTDSEEIAKIARENGAEVPFLRPAELAQDGSQVVDNIIYTLNKLKEDDKIKLGINGRKYFENEFEREKLLSKLIDIFEK